MATEVTISYSAFKKAATYLYVLYTNEAVGYHAFAAADDSVYSADVSAGADITDFDANIKPTAILAASHDDGFALALLAQFRAPGGQFDDKHVQHKFGNLSTLSASEVLLYPRTYAEPGSEAQRSVVSTNANDTDGGTGVNSVRIVYLTSAYVLKSEDVILNGTTAVNTVATDIRFIEDMYSIKGADAAGAVKLMSATGGGGSEVAGIGTATQQAFFCHHYVPAGKKAWVIEWGASEDDEVAYKLKGQGRFGANLVDRILDLRKLFGITVPPGDLSFVHARRALAVPEKSYVRVTVVPNQATATVIRGHMDIWETDAT
jgi:hypothetical protein